MKFTDDKIFLYFINPDKLKADELKSIELEIKNNKEFSDYVQEIKSLLSEIKNTEKDKEIDKLLEKNINERFSSLFNEEQDSKVRIVKLSSLGMLENEGRFVIKLAALQTKTSDDTFRYVNTFASANKLILLRAMYNRAINEYKLFLICDDMNMVQYSLVKISGIPRHFIAGKSGELTIKADFQISDLDISLHLPIARFDVNLVTVSSLPMKLLSSLDEKIILNISRSNDKYIFRFTSEESIQNPIAALIFDDTGNDYLKFKLNPEMSFEIMEGALSKTKFKVVLAEDG